MRAEPWVYAELGTHLGQMPTLGRGGGQVRMTTRPSTWTSLRAVSDRITTVPYR